MINKIKEYFKTIIIIILLICFFILLRQNNINNKNYDKLVDKYKKQINELISKKELSDNKISKLLLDMKNKELIISSLQVKNKNGKPDTNYIFNKYKLSSYTNAKYTIEIINKDSILEILPNIHIRDYGFIFEPNLSIIYTKELVFNLSVSFFHYKNFGIETGIGYGIYNNKIYGNTGINYNFWHNLIVKGGICYSLQSTSIYAGFGINL